MTYDRKRFADLCKLVADGEAGPKVLLEVTQMALVLLQRITESNAPEEHQEAAAGAALLLGVQAFMIARLMRGDA